LGRVIAFRQAAIGQKKTDYNRPENGRLPASRLPCSCVAGNQLGGISMRHRSVGQQWPSEARYAKAILEANSP
jgi:hypothetical protein